MQVQLITILLGLCFSLSVIADDSKEAKELFINYSKVMDQHKVELIDDVFTEKFIKESGGKDELIEKIKSLPLQKSITQKPVKVELKPGVKTKDLVFAKFSESSHLKGGKSEDSHSEFILIREKGKLKIQGTLSDGE